METTRALPRLSRPQVAARHRAASAMETILTAELGFRMPVRLTRNRRVLLSVRRDAAGKAVLRLHVAFVNATRAELAIVAAWVLGRPGASEAARTLIDRYAATAAATSPPRPTAKSAPPRHHDLVAILHDLRARFFPGLARVFVAWAARTSGRRQRQLGSWNETTRLIRIHPCLDSEGVPKHVIEAVVFHELCHAAAEPSFTPTGKRRIHGPEFRALERRYPHRAAAREWERSHLGDLLSC